MLVSAIQATALVAFAVVGVVSPRRAEGLFHADTGVNLLTGVLLVVFKLVLLGWLLTLVEGLGPGLIPVGGLPVWVVLPLAFLVLDFTRWALHLVHHRVPLFWRFHRVHHSSERLNSTSGLRMHVVDFVQLAFLPVVLFSVIFDLGGVGWWVLPVCLIPGAVLDAFQHANVRIAIEHPFWKTWDILLNNPHFHAWHHTAEGSSCDGNYGNALTVWDRMFGTCVSRQELPERFGLDESERLTPGVIALQLLRRG